MHIHFFAFVEIVQQQFVTKETSEVAEKKYREDCFVWLSPLCDSFGLLVIYMRTCCLPLLVLHTQCGRDRYTSTALADITSASELFASKNFAVDRDCEHIKNRYR
jgi:hypothetical protein